MTRKNCIFCKIIKEEIPAVKIWEDKNFLAILDANPNTTGMTLLMTKKHFDSYVFEMPKNFYINFFRAAQTVSRLLEKGLKVKRITLVMEGMGINHAHLKLYSLHGLEKKFQETWAQKRIFFTKYKGYISTRLGPKTPLNKLQKLAEKITKKQ